MEYCSVISKGRVTIPKDMREQLGMQQGSQVEFMLIDQHIELRLKQDTKSKPHKSGFGMVKSNHPFPPADFDVGTLIKP